ncbi:MAG: DUF2130 domain-containing protein, partial [Candidatus Dormibacteria bacterium]
MAIDINPNPAARTGGGLDAPTVSWQPVLETCPQCQHSFPISDATRASVAEAVRRYETERHLEAVARARREGAEQGRQEGADEQAVELQALREEVGELKEVKKNLVEQEIKSRRAQRKVEAEREQEKLAAEKGRAEDEKRIRKEERQRAADAHRLTDVEYEKQLKDQRDRLEEAQRKLEQGSQQLQGEVAEISLERGLGGTYPGDDITPIKTGVRGADVLQTVRTPLGTEAGKILWESKNAQTWQPAWIGKLENDMRDAGARFGVLVSAVLPAGVDLMAPSSDQPTLWVAHPRAAGAVAAMLRQATLHAHAASALSANEDERIRALHHYITSPEFQHRFEAVQGAIRELEDGITLEKRYLATRWAQRDKHVQLLVS